MTSMNDECERTCPLCAEEMDLTDQQLKPCKCGYEICVWCWHHILDMAEKDAVEGRCPACRTPYDKERVVGTAANCERLVAEVNSERKLKSQKAKRKASEGRKHLSSARVIQRNLVYVIGIPANLADEDTLERKEYFGQYGKVLKVSISRATGGGQNSSNNNAVSVYITYTKEEEAVRCIQSVHGFTLDGKTLRACFGTTKYCHAWLRNMPCSNPDCLYLHEVGVQEDSFTKDEIISAYSRSRVQQITSSANNNCQLRFGNVLPSPIDDFGSNAMSSSAKPTMKSSSTIPSSQGKISPPDGSSGRSNALPAAASWGLRVSNGQPLDTIAACSQEPFRQTVHTCASSCPPMSAHSVTASHHPEGQQTAEETEKIAVILSSSGRSEVVQSSNQSNDWESQSAADTSPEFCGGPASETGALYGNPLPALVDKDGSMGSGISSDQLLTEQHASASDQLSPVLLGSPVAGSRQHCNDNETDPTENATNLALVQAEAMSETECFSREMASLNSNSTAKVVHAAKSNDDEFLLCSGSSYMRCSNGPYVQSNEASSTNHLGFADFSVESEKVEGASNSSSHDVAVLSDGHKENRFSSVSHMVDGFGSSGPSNLFYDEEAARCSRRLEGDPSEIDQNVESSIISSILSLELDSWDDPLTSSNNLTKMLNESSRRNGSTRLPSSWKMNSNESRFTFARQELDNPTNHIDCHFGGCPMHVEKRGYSQPDPIESGSFYGDKIQNGNSGSCYKDLDSFNDPLVTPANRSPVPKAQMAAPPGFAAPNKAPPPGFSSQQTLYQAFDSLSPGNTFSETSFSRNTYQAPNGSNSSVSDIELIDPAILAVGKGRPQLFMNNSCMDISPAFPPQNFSDSELRLQLLLQQQSLSSHQQFRYSDHNDDRYSTVNDGYISSRLLGLAEENHLLNLRLMSLQQSRNSQFLSSQWDSWNAVQNSKEMNTVEELIRNGRLGFDKYGRGYDEWKLQMPSTEDLYNRAFGL